jgi:hypothetical protein
MNTADKDALLVRSVDAGEMRLGGPLENAIQKVSTIRNRAVTSATSLEVPYLCRRDLRNPRRSMAGCGRVND